MRSRSALVFAGIVIAATAAFGGDGSVHRNARHIPGRYIVELNSSADAASIADVVRGNGGNVHHSYSRGVKGLSIETSDVVAQSLSSDPRVKFVEEDATVSATSVSWGLDRIDQRALPLDGSFSTAGTGAGVSAYIVDTGILAEHQDFGGRVAAGFDAVGDNNGTTDCNGHGTHVAGIVGGAAFGVATSATLVPVRVLDCTGSGSLSTVIAGLEWVLQDHTQSTSPAVVNMSLAGNGSSALDDEVNSVLSAGLTVVVAAGNDNTSACGSSPARVAGAITVGASTSLDQRASFSNYGPCVDIFAPGTGILSDSYSSTTATSISSGTSESSPFVAGVAALILQQYPSASPTTVTQTILSQATTDALDVLTLGTGSPDRLLYSGIDTLSSGTPDAQLLGDPGFDFGTTFWSADICTVVTPTGCPPDDGGGDILMMSYPGRSGNSKATLGGKPNTFHLNSEALTIPVTVKKAQLSIYLWVVTKGNSKKASDTLTIEVHNAAGVLLATLASYSNLDANATYTNHQFDLTRFRGTPIKISFTGVQSNGPPTWFFLDDVNVNIWK
jgi:subtilase family protein/peptidase inhibitor I9